MLRLLGQDEGFLNFYFVLFTLCFIGIGISWIEICKGWRNRDKQPEWISRGFRSLVDSYRVEW